MLRAWLTIVFLLVALGTFLAHGAYDEHQHVKLREQERLVSLATALKANLGEELRASSRMLDAFRIDVPTLLAEQSGIGRLNRRMALLTESVVGVRSLVLVSAEGVVLASNRPELVGQNFKDSERYRAIKEGRDPAMLYVSPPFKTPLGAFTTSLGKPVIDPLGRFDGYVLAILDPDYFALLMDSLLYAPDMRISVVHGDGKVIFSTQTTPDIRGVDLSQRPDSLFNQHLRSGRSSSFSIARPASTGDLRFVAIQTVLPSSGSANKPLVIAVSRESGAILAEWENSALRQGILFTGLALAVCVGYYAYLLRKRAYRHLYQEKTRGEEVAEERLRETNEQFRGYFENMAVGAVQLDTAGRFQLVNDRYCEMTGYNRDELIEKLQLSDIFHPDDQASEQEHMREFFAGMVKNLDLERRMVHKDGQVIWVHVSAHAVRDPEGNIKFTTVVIEDVTQRKQLMGELESAKMAAEAANRAKTLFLGNMSHEMRTPLHQISGVASMFRRDALTEKQFIRLGLLETAAKRLDTVIGGILTLVDIEAQSTEVKLVPVDMKQVVGGVATMLVDSAAQKNLVIDQVIAPLPSPLMGDARHLRTILSCYCSNAITFSASGKISIRVRPLNEDVGSVMVRIEVEDEGAGIAAEHIDRLFERFEQADNSHTRKYGGTGVGLAIVKNLARLMGGDAGCQSVLGQGSTFWASARLVKGVQKDLPAEAGVADFQI